MSRLIVKNLPKNVKEEKLRDTFSAKGRITDLRLVYTKSGVFRRFCFIGYSTDEEAQNAIKHFNNTFIDTSKLQVAVCSDFNDSNKERPWSKHSKGSSAYERYMKKMEANEKSEMSHIVGKADYKKKKKRIMEDAREAKISEMLGELKDDPEFQEFMDVHKNRKTKSLWEDTRITNVEKGIKNDTTSPKKFESKASLEDDDDEGKEIEADNNLETDGDATATKALKSKKSKSPIKKEGVSDLDFLKSKVKSNLDVESKSSSVNEDEKNEKPVSKMSDKEKYETYFQKPLSPVKERFAVKIRGFPTTVKEKQLRDFFNPLKVLSVKIPRNAKHNSMGVAYVDFETEQDQESASRRNKNYIAGKRVLVKKVMTNELPEEQPVNKPKRWEMKVEQEDKEMEAIGETGRLYVRNLSYDTCTEETLEELFGKYGPLTEVHVPIDKFTKKMKGFAFVTFMMPEHAVKAFSELDGTILQGRMLHILPALEQPVTENSDKGPDTFKKKREKEKKANAGSSHNWNALFLGANAVADVMANKYGKSKGVILDMESNESLGVRMALGETQIIAETRQFLIDNGVQLDAFSQAAAPRSKTVILIKNLPASTKAEELREVFSVHGEIGRVVLPPSGITAILEFVEVNEAKVAFRSLAYRKFHHIPLYLEWAPVEVFKKPYSANLVIEKNEDENMQIMTEENTDNTESNEGINKPRDSNIEENNDSNDETDPEDGSTIFVKGLNFTTEDETINKVFSQCGPVHSATVAKKKDMAQQGAFLSMGYGFVTYKKKTDAQKALKELQHTEIDGFTIELKMSNRTSSVTGSHSKKKQDTKKQLSTKILVRNLPFEASEKEISKLFKVFGELKAVRMPKKLSGTGSHRGFGFVDFLTKQDAKRAFDALCHSTHFFGRRLVLEWAENEESVDEIRKRTSKHFHRDETSKRLKKSNLLGDLKSGASASSM